VCVTDESKAAKEAVIWVFSHLEDGHNYKVFSLFSQFFVTPHQNDNLRGRESTNGRKTAVIGVTGFLCVPLRTSTVQLHDSLRSRRACARSQAGFNGQNGDRAYGVYYRGTSASNRNEYQDYSWVVKGSRRVRLIT
jgi:hypothetical protein